MLASFWQRLHQSAIITTMLLTRQPQNTRGIQHLTSFSHTSSSQLMSTELTHPLWGSVGLGSEWLKLQPSLADLDSSMQAGDSSWGWAEEAAAALDDSSQQAQLYKHISSFCLFDICQHLIGQSKTQGQAQHQCSQDVHLSHGHRSGEENKCLNGNQT